MNTTSMKEMVKQWEQRNGQKVTSALEVKLNGMSPPVEKMDPILSTFTNCEKLSLSTNVIERIANLSGLKKLKILSLGRNNIKSLSGIEAAGETLEELWLSYNLIEKLKGIGSLKKLRLLTLANNLIRDWSEISRLVELHNLKEIVLVGNPIEERHSAEGNWRSEMVRRLPNLAKLDGWHVTTENELQPEDSTIPPNEEAEVQISDQVTPEVFKEPNLEDDGKPSVSHESTNEEVSSPRKGSTTL